MHTNRLFTNPRQALVWLALVGAIVFLLKMSALPAISFLSVGIVLFPLLLLLVIALAGIIPAFFSLALMLLAARAIYGNGGLWLAVYLLPVSAAFSYCLDKELPFFRTCGVLIAAMVCGILVVFLTLQRLSGGSAYEPFPKPPLKGWTFSRCGTTCCTLSGRAAFYPMGRKPAHPLKAPSLADGPSGLRCLKSSTSRFLHGFPPWPPRCCRAWIQLLHHPVGRRLRIGPQAGHPVRHRAQPADAALLQVVHPQGLWAADAALALGYLITILSASPVLMLAGQLMFNVFSALYIIQGLAYVNFIMKRRGTTRPVARFLLLLLLFIILSPAAMFIGIFDQFSDPRQLRAEQAPPFSA